MGLARNNTQKVKLFFGLLATTPDLLETARARLSMDYSEIDIESPVIPFDQSNYYEPEMGPGLLRQWIATDEPVFMHELVSIKRSTNQLEQCFATEGNRQVNVDPGYVSLSKVVLATTKDYDHRIYVRNGIYEEVTLHYRRPGGFTPWPWTYPDYRTDVAAGFFREARLKLQVFYRSEANTIR
jgi:hypothetical protein